MASLSPKILSIHLNKKALWDYEILESFEAGVLLSGAEVKSIRAGNVNLRGAWVGLSSGFPEIIGMHVGTYGSSARIAHDQKRSRQALLHKKDILRLIAKQKEGWSTLIPTEIYLKWSLIKVRIALARGRKQFDKKQLLKERTVDRELDREVKKYIH